MHVLVVEDSKFFSKAVETGLARKCGASVTVAKTRHEAITILDTAPERFDFALVDLILPDSHNGEVVDDVLAYEVPTVVFTGIYSPEFRQKMLEKPIIDYVLKDSPSSIDYVVSLISRLKSNIKTEVLIVDDSRFFRLNLKRLLHRYQFKTHEAHNAQTALETLKSRPNIRLVVTDQHMPDIDGVELIKRIRLAYSMETLAIIGMSSSGNADLSAKFIKYGANDFISKNFVPEEFLCRISQNLHMLELLEQMRNAATTDFLTGLKNRSYFFEAGARLTGSQSREAGWLSVAMIDLDNFKTINDTHGHDAGDIVLKSVAEELATHQRAGDVVARMGGEEFALLLPGMDKTTAKTHFENLRKRVEALDITYSGARIPVTCSIGVTSEARGELEDLLKQADEMLYRAKRGGRNRIEMMERPSA